jgi:tRNA(adenine34) deaminase
MSSASSWEKLSKPWQAAVGMAWEAYLDGCFPIGAVVADADGNILATGRNRIYEKREADWGKRGAELAHAEVEALTRLDFSSIDVHTCALYTTTEPCPMCMGTFYISGVRNLHYLSREPWAGSVDMLGKTWYLSRKPIKVFAPFDPVFEVLIMALMIERELAQQHVDAQKPWNLVYQRWQKVVPGCLDAGKNLFESGVLADLAKNKATTAEMVDCLYDRVKLFT